MSDSEISESRERLKEELMAVAKQAGEKSTTETFSQDELGRRLGLYTGDPGHKSRLSEAVGELVEEGRLEAKSKNAEHLSLGSG